MKKKHDTLVLNRNYVPIQIVDWKSAMTLIYKDSAHPIDNNFVSYTFDSWLKFSKCDEAHTYANVKTSSHTIAIPEIIVLVNFDRLPDKEVKFARQNIFKTYNYICAYCGKEFKEESLTLDHILPRSLGGETNWNNIVPSCRPCNNKKANHTLSESGMGLLYKPKRPKWISPLNGIKIKNHPCKSWEHFLNKV